MVVFITIALSSSDNMIVRLGFESDYWVVALIALLVAGLLRDKSLGVIGLVLFLSLVANMPGDFVMNFGIDRDYFFGALVGLILAPVVVNWLE